MDAMGSIRIYDRKEQKHVSYGLARRTQALLHLPAGTAHRVLEKLDTYTVRRIREAQRRSDLSQEIGFYGRYGSCTTQWEEEDGSSRLWTFCRKEEREKLHDLLEDVPGIGYDFFDGDILMRTAYDHKASETDWKRYGTQGIHLCLHAPYGDWEEERTGIVECLREGKLGEGIQIEIPAKGSWRSLPGSSPHVGEVGALVKDFSYKLMWLYLEEHARHPDLKSAIRTLKQRMQTFELPVITLFTDFLPLLKATKHAKGMAERRFDYRD